VTRLDAAAMGVGPTPELSLRVSAACLVRVTFTHPISGQALLALERKASAGPNGAAVVAQPFGGGVRLLRPEALLERIPVFHYDSERTRAEQDFRILVRPEDWPAVRRFCVEQFSAGGGDALEADPARELAEEAAETLGFDLLPAHYQLKRLGILVEGQPRATENIHAVGAPTVRIYHLFEAELLKSELIRLILATSADLPDSRLAQMARADPRGRANSALALPLDALRRAYLGLPAGRRDETWAAEGHALSGNVAALLPGVSVAKYERLEEGGG